MRHHVLPKKCVKARQVRESEQVHVGSGKPGLAQDSLTSHFTLAFLPVMAGILTYPDSPSC